MKRWTGKTAREAIGVGGIIDPHHEGPMVKRPTESGLDNFSPKTNKTPADFRRERDEKEAARKRRSSGGEAKR